MNQSEIPIKGGLDHRQPVKVPFTVLDDKCQYLLFLPRGRLSLQDAGIHRLDVLHHQAEELVAETKHQLEDREAAGSKKKNPAVKTKLCVSVCVCVDSDLLGDREGLVVELLDELGCHLV